MLPRRWLPRSSIRLRLTAWYTLLLALALLLVGVVLPILLGRSLRDDVDRRLLRTASNIYEKVQVQPGYGPGLLVQIPSLNPLASPGQVAQIVDNAGNVYKELGDLGGQVLPFAPVIPGDTNPAFVTATLGGVDVRTVRLAMVTEGGGKTLGAIVVGEPLDPVNRTLGLLRRLLILASVVGIALAAAGGYLLARHGLRPVDNVTATAAAIAAGEGPNPSLSARLEVPDTGDEIARLASTFNAMLDRLETAFATQRRFVADASHELRTPLTAIRGNVDVLARQRTAENDAADADDTAAALGDIGRESARMGRLLDDLLLLARADAAAAGGTPVQPTPQPVRLDLVAEEAVRTATALADGQQVDAGIPAPVVVPGDHDRLLQLTLILLDNAIRHTPPDGRITVTVEPAGPGRARLVVRDTGEGIAPEHLSHIFERFYRVDGARTRATGGTGLGLAIAQTIARAHGGEIAVASAPGAGSTFTVTLPHDEPADGSR